MWFYENKQKYRTRSRGVWLPYEFYFAPNETLSVNFSNGHPAGVYNYSNNNINNKSKITGQFNANGLINGTWILNTSDEKQEYIDKKEDEYTEKFANPYVAAKYGFIDDVIEPRNTRFRIVRALELLQNKKEVNPPKKHSNIPL